MAFWVIVAEIVKAILTVKKYADTLSSLQNGKLVENLIISYVGTKMNDALVKSGISLDKLHIPDIEAEVESWADGKLREVNDALLQNGIVLAPNRLKSEFKSRLNLLLEGKSIGNGKPSIRSQAVSADPIILSRGEYERQVIDLEVKGAGMDLTFCRTYRSSGAYFGPFGKNWDHAFNLRLREDNETIVARFTGELSEDSFIRHPRFGEELFTYYSPQDGIHDIVVPDIVSGSYMLKRPLGITFYYESTVQPHEHRIRRIEDRLGNFLEFHYDSEDQLERIFVNSFSRYVFFSYDEYHRIRKIEDHTKRSVFYTYDDQGYLSSVTEPAISFEDHRIVESYEYESVGGNRKIVRVLDWKDRIMVENEYDRRELSEFFGYVIRQVENHGETIFLYENIQQKFDPYNARDIPLLRVWEIWRNGHQVEHLFNAFGNELQTKQRLLVDGQIHEAITYFRYNADGQIIARLNADGTLIQNLYSREHLADSKGWIDTDPIFANASVNERMSFGNLLATKTHALRIDLSTIAGAQELWEKIPSIKTVNDPHDIVGKYEYEENGQLLLSSSDPRHTVSADPLHVESSHPGDPLFNSSDVIYLDHQRYLTRFEYGPKPHLRLLKVLHPDRTRPSELDGISNVTNIDELFVKYDSNGRVMEKLDGRGYSWFCEYYDAASGPKEGFLRRELKPHIDLTLNNGTPDILEIKRTGAWDQLEKFMQSGGMIGDAVELTVEGVRLSLFQSNEMTDITSANQEVAVSIDGVPKIPWNQSADTDYTITDLKPGVHSVKLSDTLGITFTIGRVRSHVSIDYDIDDLGRIIHQFDPRGNMTINAIDAMGRKTKIVSGPVTNPSVTYFSYGPAGQLILERSEWRNENGQIHPEAIVRNYEYNKVGLLVSESTGSVEGNKRTTYYRYDTDNNLYESINSRGIPTYFTYDELNRPSKTIRGACSLDKSVTTTIYDIANNVLATIDPRNAMYYNGYIDSIGLRHSGIDTRGRIWAKTDPLGNIVVTDFDAIDNSTVIRQFQHRIDGKEELVSRKETQYDEHGDISLSIEAVFDSPIITADPINDPDKEFMLAVSAGKILRAVTEYHLDSHGNILYIRDPAGGIQRQKYDGQNRWYDQIDAEGRRTFRIFDANGNIKRIYAFDPVWDQSSNKILYYEVFNQTHEYDELDRELSHMDSYGNKWSQEFDSVGNKIVTMDPLGNVVRFEYNSFGELITTIQERTDSGGNPLPALVTRRHYDESGNIIDITDPLDRHTKFTYDNLDRLIECWFAVSVANPRERRKYDPAGNLLSIQYQNGLIKRMTYDLMNRNIRMDIDTSAISSNNALSSSTTTFSSYHYDAAGNRKREENNYCIVEFDRDSRGMPITQRVTIQNIPEAPGTLEFTQRFDISGRRTELIYPSGRQISYVYDLMGRVLSVQNVSSPPDYPGRLINANDFTVASYTYTGRRLAHIDLGNKLSVVLQFDGRGHVLERSIHSPSKMLWRLQQLRDATGHVRFESSITVAGSQSRKYILDSIYRLTHYNDYAVQWVDPMSLSPAHSPVDTLQATNQDAIDTFIASLENPLGEQIFVYDDIGNFSKIHEPGLMPLDLASNTLNQYTLVNNVPWQYDANGNLKSDGIRAFRYDANNALKDIIDEATSTNLVTYFHDSVGRVIAEKTQLGTIFRIYNGTLPLVELSTIGRTEFTAGHQSDTILHAALGGEDYWLSYDGLLSMRLLTNGSGEVISMPSFRPFGGFEDDQIQSSPLRSVFGGMWHTPGLPFYHSDRRTYRPDVGRYLQRDPVGLIDSLNLYSYVGNNPVNYIDLTGLQRKIASKVAAEALEWISKKGKGVIAHGAKGHAQGGLTKWEKLARKLTNREARIRYLREYETKSVLEKGNQAKKFVTRTLKKYDRAIYQDHNKRWLFIKNFGRQIDREGATAFSVVVEEATGKVKTFFPTRTMVALVAAGTGSLTAFGEGVAEASTHGEREELEFIKRHHLEDFSKEEWVLDTLNDLSAENERSWIDEGRGKGEVPAGIAKRIIKAIESEKNTPLDEQTKSDINEALYDAYFHKYPEIEVDEPEDSESIDESIDAELEYLNVPVPSIVTHRDY